MDAQAIQNKRILITGGLGFIGSSIAHRCVKSGAQVTLLDACLDPYGWNPFNIYEIRNRIRFVRGDVRDRAVLESVVPGHEIVFHLAAQVGREISMNHPILDVETNCGGMIHLLEVCRRVAPRPKIIYAGSRGQIGEPVALPVDESHPENPTDIYGINKMAAERYLMLYGKVYDMDVVSLRLNNVYGPRCQMHAGFYGILNWFMANAMTGRPITVYGKGKQTRDYIYIDDVVDAFIRAAVLPGANREIFFVGSGVETVFLDMVREVVRAAGKGEIVHVPFPESREKIDIKRFVVSTHKIQNTLEWTPKTDLRTGIESTARYYRNHLKHYLEPKTPPENG